jgi:Leucine-rich repeat (LRR) protein/tRNA A-37 threonylcarbamoyl transferase component Bud32
MGERQAAHPDLDQLQAFSLGRLDDDATSSWISLHLDTCTNCLKTLESIGGDELEDLVRAGDVAAAAPAPRPNPFPDHPRYHVEELLGAGGMGAVYRARHLLMERDVALKVIHPKILEKSASVDRFRREVKAAARLAHPNIVTAYDADQAADMHFLVMEFVPGKTLAQVVAECGPLPIDQAADYVRQAALGLQHAHERNMVHRDIKPANLIVTHAFGAQAAGLVKILDFGLAHASRELASDGTVTEDGTVMGTPDYMAPEQADDARSADIRADVYSLGCTLYHLLTGQPPFPRGTAIQKIKAHQTQVPPPVTELRPEVPPELACIVERMMAKDRAERHQTPAEVAEALTAFLQQRAAPPGAREQEALVIKAQRADDSRPLSAVSKRGRFLRRCAAAAVMLACLSLVGYFCGGTIIRFATNQGEVVVQIDDDNVELRITQNGVVVQDTTSKRQFTLTAGRGEIEVLETDGVKLATRKFTLTRGGKTTVTVTLVELADRRAAEWVLSVGGTIRVNNEDRDIRVLAELPKETFRLTFIELKHNPLVTDAGLAHCKGCKNLTQLHLLYMKPVTDKGLAYFKDCKNLTHLNIRGIEVGDAALVHFRDCQNLTYLCLDSTHVGDAGLACFKDRKNLTALGLNFLHQISDAGLAHFRDCKKLTVLSVGNTQISDVGLASFKDCKNLENLLLNDTKIGDTGLANFKGCKNLKELYLANTQVSDRGLTNFNDCKNLTRLQVNDTQVGDEGMAHFKDCKDLKWLFLDHTGVGDTGLAHFKDCKNLEYLLLSGNPVTDVGLAHFKNCSNLERLFLAGTQVSDTGLACIKGCRLLTHLELDSTRVSDTGIPVLTRLSQLVELKVANTKISLQGYHKLRAALPKCQLFWP